MAICTQHKQNNEFATNSESSMNIFSVYKPDRLSNQDIVTENEIELNENAETQLSFSPACNPTEYTKHTNLDVRPLSFAEQLNLLRIYYLTIPKAIHYGSLLFCFSWFIFNIYSVLYSYLEHNSYVMIEYKQPDWTKPPAFTICTSCIICS